MAVLFEKTKLLTDKQFHYCPGCNHGIIHRLVAEVIDEMNLDGKVIGVAPVGCSVFAIRATATWPLSAPPRSSTPPTAARRSSPSSSTTPFTA